MTSPMPESTALDAVDEVPVWLEVNGQPAEDLDAFMELYKKSTEAKEAQVLLSVARRQGTRTVLLKVTS